MENQSNFVNKYKTKYTDFEIADNSCTISYDVYTPQVSNSNLDQIENNDFWNHSYDYGIFTDYNGNKLGLKGVCNSVILNSCNDPKNDNDGICGVNNYINTKKYFLDYKSCKRKVSSPTTVNNTI